MALTNEQITAQNFKDFYGQIRPYLNGAAHSGFTPVGTVISVMGKTAPLNYLVCDGTVYNIADYSELANYFAGQFEAANFFGGDGVTTFAVPDLRGEFLRGTGTNSHANQGSGANVGVHQDGTALPYYEINGSNHRAYFGNGEISNYDNDTTDSAPGMYADGTTFSTSIYRTVRPTNTSVLYCIATKNIFMDAGMNFSTEEQVVGTWIDGKPIYQKTVMFSTPYSVSSTAWCSTNISASGIEIIVNGEGYSLDGVIQSRPMSFFADGVIKIMSARDEVASDSISGVTYRYTKTTD